MEVSLQAFGCSGSGSNTLHLAWISPSVAVPAGQMFHCCSDERSTSRIKDPVSIPTYSACFEPGTRKKVTCTDL